MALYDAFGNITGFSDAEAMNPMDEEERRRREIEAQLEAYRKQQEELASEVVNKQEIVTHADGSQTRTIKQEMPASTQAIPAPVAPVAPVAAPMDQTAYNQRIAQMESGARPNIGYHDQSRSTAYGPYGLTQAAYADARRRNPNLPQDITQATPEQQQAAQTAFTDANAGYLQSYGVPVNENTLSAAHFLGAKGLSDYLKTGYISPQAAAANGGEANVRRIVDQRLGGQAAPASGAAPTPSKAQAFAAQQGQAVTQPPVQRELTEDERARLELDNKIKQYESIQNDPKALMNFQGDDWMVANAQNRAADILTARREQQKAEETLRTASDTDLARYLRSTKEDSMTMRIKAMLFNYSGNKEMAQRYMDKVDNVGTDKYIQGDDGKPYLVRQRANGEIIEAYDATSGQRLTDKDMIRVGAGVAGAKGVEQGADVFMDPTGTVKGTFVLERRPGRTPIYKEIGTGRTATREESAVLRKSGVQGTLADQKARQIQEINLKLQGKGVEEQMAILRTYNQQLVAQGFPPVQPSEVGISVPQIGGGAARPSTAPAQGAPVQQGAAPAQGAAVAPAQGAAPAAPAQRPTGPQLAATAEARKDIAQKAAAVVADQGNMIADIERGNNAIDILNNKKTNFGAILQGIIPGEQAVGKALGTEDARNTQKVMEVLDKVTAAGAKALGANPTDRDLQFLLGNRPNESWPAAEVANWIQRVQERTRANIEIARKQVETGGAYQPPIPQTGGTAGGSGKTSSGNTYRKL